MCLGALVDAGMPLEILEHGLKKLHVSGYTLSARRAKRASLSCTKVDVVLTGKGDAKTGCRKWEDMEKIIRAAKERGCVLEENAHPYRLDLTDVHCRLAKEIGAKIAISTDAHSTGDLDFMRFGALQARRGWIEPEDVINTRPLEELKKLLKRK